MSSPMTQTTIPSNHQHNVNTPGIGTPSGAPAQPVSREFTMPFFIYLVKYHVKEHNGYITSHGVVKAYSNVQQANQKAIRLMKKLDCEEWKRSYNQEGCAYLKAEKDDGPLVQVEVKRMRVRWPGDKPEEGEEGVEEDSEGGDEEESEEREKGEEGEESEVEDLFLFEERMKDGRDEDEESR